MTFRACMMVFIYFTLTMVCNAASENKVVITSADGTLHVNGRLYYLSPRYVGREFFDNKLHGEYEWRHIVNARPDIDGSSCSNTFSVNGDINYTISPSGPFVTDSGIMYECYSTGSGYLPFTRTGRGSNLFESSYKLALQNISCKGQKASCTGSFIASSRADIEGNTFEWRVRAYFNVTMRPEFELMVTPSQVDVEVGGSKPAETEEVEIALRGKGSSDWTGGGYLYAEATDQISAISGSQRIELAPGVKKSLRHMTLNGQGVDTSRFRFSVPPSEPGGGHRTINVRFTYELL